MDSNFFVNFLLSLWIISSLEYLSHATIIPCLLGFLSGCYFPQGNKSGKDIIKRHISAAVKRLANLKGLIGANLVWKFSSTRVWKCDSGKDDRALRGWWERAKMEGYHTNDIELPW